MPQTTKIIIKVEGKDYGVVKIGYQYWLAKNYSKFGNEEFLTWHETVEIAEKHDYLRLPTDADWLELKNWVKGKYTAQSEGSVLKDSTWGGKKGYCDKCGFLASPAGYIFTNQDKVMDSGKYAFFWSADDLGHKDQAHCWCLDFKEDVLYQATFPKTVKMSVRYLVDSSKIDDFKGDCKND